MSEKCKNGLEYHCPHIESCESDEGEITSTNPKSPHLIYIRSKEWSSTTQTWSDNENLYSCQPQLYFKKRNIEVITGKKFYKQDAKKVREASLREAQEAIEKLVSLTNRS